MRSALEYPILGNALGAWLVAILLAGLAFTLLFTLRNLAATRLTRAVLRRAPGWDKAIRDLAEWTHPVLIALVSVLIGSQVLVLPGRAREFLLRVLAVTLVIQGGLWAGSLFGSVITRYHEQKLKDDPGRATTVQVLGFLGRITIWCLVGLLVLANLGVEIAPLLAGLGVGGIAVALAVQTVLKDLLASLSIMLDRPFMIGDFLNLGTEMGSVEYIGLRTTRLRSISGEQLILSNADLLESRIRNFGRMRERRIVFNLGVTYGTPREKLVRIPTLIREAIESQQLTRFDRSHFKEFGDSALIFETVFFMAVPDYMAYMNVQQAINLRLYESFEREGVEFAFPTQTLHLVRPGPREASKPEAAR